MRNLKIIVATLIMIILLIVDEFILAPIDRIIYFFNLSVPRLSYRFRRLDDIDKMTPVIHYPEEEDDIIDEQ